MRSISLTVVLNVAWMLMTSGTSVRAQLPGPPTGRPRVSPMAELVAGLNLLNTPEGQKELKITEEQKGKIQKLQDNWRSNLAERTPPAQLLPEDERRAKTDALMQEYVDEVKRDIQKLLDANQFRRFEQITIQTLGLSAFSLPANQKALKFTEEQKSRFEAMIEAAMIEVAQKLRNNQLDRDAAKSAISEIRNQAMEKAIGLLSEEQKKTWNGLVGTPFQRPEVFQLPPIEQRPRPAN